MKAKLNERNTGKLTQPSSALDLICAGIEPGSGIWELPGGRYSGSFRILDTGYSCLDDRDREELLRCWCSALAVLEPGTEAQITSLKRKLTRKDLEKGLLMDRKGDWLDRLREEYDRMLLSALKKGSGGFRENILTLTVRAGSTDEAASSISRLSAAFSDALSGIGSGLLPLGTEERLSACAGLICPEEAYAESDYSGFDPRACAVPDYARIGRKGIEADGRFIRVLYIRDYPAALSDGFFSRISGDGFCDMASVSIVLVNTAEAVKDARKRLLGIDTGIASWARRQNENSNFAASVPYSLKSQRETLTEFLDDLSKRDQKMFLAVVTAAVSGRTMDELESKTSALMSCAEGYGCRFSVLGFEQYEGLETVMPLGLRCVSPLRTLTSESLSALVPFRTREVFHFPGGTYRGINTVSGSIISIDRSRLINGNEFILGVPGSGKSFCAKNEIASLAMRGDCDIVIVDPEREYSRLVRMIGGETVCISPDSGCHINALDLVPAEEGDPVSEKSDFVLTLIGEIMEKDEPGPGEKSVIDRCLRKVLLRDGPGIPTLKDLRDEISRQTDPGAAETALALEIFTEGSLSTFSKPTNVDFSSHIVSYDISEMGRQLEPAAMLVILDSIAGRIERNRRSGRRTYLFIDEFYLLMRRERSARFLSVLWKRVRKCGAFATGITQNVDEVLGSPSASTMLANSELTVMMRQAPQDLERLSGLLGIGKEAGKWLSSPDPGTGLIKVGNDLIPFTSGFPEGTELYGLMTTRPGEAPAS